MAQPTPQQQTQPVPHRTIILLLKPIIHGLSHSLSHGPILLLGQVLSLLLASTGAISATLHLQCHLSAPTFQSLFLYGALSLHAVGLVVRKRRRRDDGVGGCATIIKGGRNGGGRAQRNWHKGRWWLQRCHQIVCGRRRKINVPNADDLTLSEEVNAEGSSSEEGSWVATPTLEKNQKPKSIGRAAAGFVVDEHPPPLRPVDDSDGLPTVIKTTKRSDTDEFVDDEQQQEDRPTKTVMLFNVLPITSSPALYVLLAFLDVEANYLTFLSYKYTTLTSVSVFDSLSIPSAMVLSRLVLGRRYRGLHLAGAGVCLLGTLLNVLSDYEDPVDAEDYPKKVMGDCFAIAGGILYGLNAVLAELVVKNCEGGGEEDGGGGGNGGGGQGEEYLAVLGVFGTIISTVQVLLLERREVGEFFVGPDIHRDIVTDDDHPVEEPTCSRMEGIGLLCLYVLANYVSYVGVARFLTVSESALLKLSLLTGDLWAVLFSVFAEHIVPAPLFWLALVMIVSGVFVYEIAPSPLDEDDKGHDRMGGEVVLDEEYVNWMDNYVRWVNELELGEEEVRGAMV